MSHSEEYWDPIKVVNHRCSQYVLKAPMSLASSVRSVMPLVLFRLREEGLVFGTIDDQPRVQPK